MLASSLRTIGLRGPSVASRAFSTTSAASAAEVKSLGVIGAGQMVRFDIIPFAAFNVSLTMVSRDWELPWWLPKKPKFL